MTPSRKLHAGRDAAGRTHWSLRSMARASGHAPSTIHRIWRAFGLQPHRSETFKLSSDPFFVEKVRDIVGLYGAAGSCPGSLCRRKEPDPGPGPFPDAPRAGGAAQPRLQAPRRPLSSRPSAIGKCFPRHRAPSSANSVVEANVPATSWTTTGPTRPRRSATGSPNGRAGRPIHQRLLAEPGRALVRAADTIARRRAPSQGPRERGQTASN